MSNDKESGPIHATTLRSDVQARFADGRTFNAPRGTTVETFVRHAYPESADTVVAALVNGKLRELALPLQHDSDVQVVNVGDSDGARIYRRSLAFLLIVACKELMPDVTIVIQHSMPYGGVFCERSDKLPLSDSQRERLERRMRELVAEDLEICRVRMPLSQAIEHFQAVGDPEKAELFAHRRKDYLTMYALNGVHDYFHGFMVPRTRYLTAFALQQYDGGFVLRFPLRREPDRLQPIGSEPNLSDVFQEYSNWLKIIGVPSVTSLNRATAEARLREVILIAEALHQRQLSIIADRISARRDSVKIVLISGPTSAGKTTLSKRLAVQLLARGIHPVAIGLDNYFVSRDNTPRDAFGDYDYEHVDAVDLPLFVQHLQLLLERQKIVQPVYNFISGEREWGNDLSLREDQMLIIEGIHGLNPRLVAGIPESACFRIFVNAFTQLNLDKHNRVPTTDTRKLRRMVRDFTHRGYDAAATIRRWPKVRQGEKRWIFPFENNADAKFNSALVYELAALKPLAEPILLQVEPDMPERVEANRLRAFLQWFDPVPPDVLNTIPGDSLLREFIGGSIIEKFEPWRIR